MGRPLRVTLGGLAYHTLNRSSGRFPIFEHDEGFIAFEKILTEAVERFQGRPRKKVSETFFEGS
jgi:putative transposase